jgi:hypothetical protein
LACCFEMSYKNLSQTLNGLRTTSELVLADPDNLILRPSCMSSEYKTAHVAALLAIRHEFEFKGLQALHTG